MTIALIVLIVFLVLWGNDSLNKKVKKIDCRKATITNIPLQDELWKKNFLKVVADLEKMDKETPLYGDVLMDALEFLYGLYDIPDLRGDESRVKNRERFRNYYSEFFQEDANLTLSQRIHCVNKKPEIMPHFKDPNLLFGTRNTSITIDGFSYEYGDRGIPSNLYMCPPGGVFFDIIMLITMRDLKYKGFNYSGDRKDSDWQQREAKLKAIEEREEKYPWL